MSIRKKLIFVFVLGFILLPLSVLRSQVVDTTNHPQPDVDDFLFDTETFDDEETDMGGYIPDASSSSDDVFVSSAAVNFNIAYFKNRGLDSRYQHIAINGVKMENMVLGRASNTQWGGLTRIFHSAKCVINLGAPAFAFGGFSGASNYNVSASLFRKQLNVSYMFGNGNYNNRVMLTYATGKLKNGWSVAASVSGRFGTQLSWVEGLSYKGFSYFFAAEKQLGSRHSLNFATWGSPVQQGMQVNCVPEVYSLVGNHYYNPNWGWYNGERRNARNRDTYEPVAMLTHKYTSADKKTLMTTSIATTFGHKNTTAFAFARVADPHPDYYRYLPSYFADSPEDYEWYLNQWQTNADFRQIDWDGIIAANQTNADLGGPSLYIIENRISKHVQIAGSSTLNVTLNDKLKLCAGVDIRGYRQHNYKVVDDLLGGNFWISRDKYADTAQDPNLAYYDLDNAGALLVEGDKCGYDYAFTLMRQSLWASLQYAAKRLDFHVGGNVSATELQRKGYMRYGAYSDNAKGNSEMKLFPDYGVKTGMTYKMGAYNALSANAHFQTVAPTAASAFVNALYSNEFIQRVVSEKDMAADLSYTISSKGIKLRASVYYVYFTDGTENRSFYHDKYGCFVNYSLTGINRRNMGVELGAEIPVGKMFSVLMAGNWGDFVYTNRPQASISANNGYAELEHGQRTVVKDIYWKNYHVAGTPQTAATAGVKFSHKDWQLKLNANFFDKVYAALNSERRTSDARGFLDDDDPLLAEMLQQERIKPQFTIDISISKSWKMKKKSSLGVSLKITNITNNQDVITSISEQHRFDYSTYSADAYDNKCYYAQGITFNFGLNFTLN